MQEWERKFDEEQKIKEEALMENFYKDSIDENKKLDFNKSDNELNKNEINHEISEKEDSSKQLLNIY